MFIYIAVFLAAALFALKKNEQELPDDVPFNNRGLLSMELTKETRQRESMRPQL
jgi:hypothetical protein